MFKPNAILLLIFGMHLEGHSQNLGQTEPATLDSLIFKGDSLFSFLVQNRLKPELELDDLPNWAKIRDITDHITGEQRLNKMPQPKAVVQARTSAYLGEANELYPGNTVFSTISATADLSASKIPLSLNASLNFQNGIFSKNLSGIGAGFNKDALYRNRLQSIKKKYANEAESLLATFQELGNLSESEKAFLLEETKFEVYQKVATNPRFQVLKQKWEYTRDSIQCEIEERQGAVDSTVFKKLEKAKSVLARLEQAENRYRELWNKRKLNPQQILDLQEKLNLKQIELRQKGAATILDNHFATKAKTLREKMISRTKALEVGMFQAEISEFTLHGQPLAGFDYEWQGKAAFASICLGRRNLTSSISPWNYTSYWDFLSSGKMLGIAVGVGNSEKSFSKIAFLRGTTDGISTDSVLILPKQNLVFSHAARKSVSKHWEVESEIATSFQSYAGQQPTTDLPPNSNFESAVHRSAFSLGVNFKPEKGTGKFSFGYFQIGPGFYSIGNPYLISNRKLLSFGAQARVFKKKLLLDSRLNLGKTFRQATTTTVQTQNFQYIGSATFLMKRGSVGVQFVPNLLKINSQGWGGSLMDNNIYTCSANLNYKIFGIEQATTGVLTNQVNQLQFSDTTNRFENTFLNLQHSLRLADQWFFDFRHMASFGSGGVGQGSGGGDYLYQFDLRKKGKWAETSLGSQFSKNRWDGLDKAGLVLAVQSAGKRKIRFGLQATLRKPYKKNQNTTSNRPLEMLCGTEIRYSF